MNIVTNKWGQRSALVQLGGPSLTDADICERLVMTYAEKIDGPVHYVPEIEMVDQTTNWPRRGIMW